MVLQKEFAPVWKGAILSSRFPKQIERKAAFVSNHPFSGRARRSLIHVEFVFGSDNKSLDDRRAMLCHRLTEKGRIMGVGIHE
jgi:hypothetical protein